MHFTNEMRLIHNTYGELAAAATTRVCRLADDRANRRAEEWSPSLADKEVEARECSVRALLSRRGMDDSLYVRASRHRLCGNTSSCVEMMLAKAELY